MCTFGPKSGSLILKCPYAAHSGTFLRNLATFPGHPVVELLTKMKRLDEAGAMAEGAKVASKPL